jgi:site-specific DNA-methyltransferase (adenine-specific)
MSKTKKTLSDLIPDSKNFNKGTAQGDILLTKSIEEFGFREAATLDVNGVLIGGNKRTAKAGQLGFEEVEIIKADSTKVYALQYDDIDITTEKGRRLALALNQTASKNILIDAEMVEAELSEAVCEEWGVNTDKILSEAKEDDFDGVAPKIPISVLGDLYEIGEHRLLCGDSTQTDTFAKLFDNQLADLVVTDPPYNVAYEGKTKEKLTIDNDKQSDESFYQFLYDFYTALGSYTKAGGAWYVWHADSEGANFRLAMKNAGIMVKQCLIWVKQSMVMGRQDYQWKHEPCLYGWKEGAAHGWYSDRKQTTILNFDRPSRNAEHPTMKPIPLFAYQIGNSSKQGDIVADGFGGSGTTMVACEQMRRKAYLVEFDPKYCDVIVARMIKLNSELIIKRNGIILPKDEVAKFTENTNG